MKAQLRVLSGARKGMFGVYAKDVITLGRHPSSDLPLDPDLDLDVSARHAEVRRRGDRWVVRDAGSRNGTLVNGHPVTGDVPLGDTDQIRLGPDGPHVEFRLVPQNTPDSRPTPPRAPAPTPAAAAADELPRATSDHQVPPPRQSTTQRIRMEVGRQTRRLRRVTLVLFGLLLLSAGLFFWDRGRQAALREREVAAMQARLDSILAASESAIENLRGRLEGLGDALRRSQAEVQELTQRLATAQRAGDDREIAELSGRLAEATAALRTQQIAAEVNYAAINDANQLAVAMIWVEFAPGDVQTGTAFAVTPEGRLVTNRHVVAGREGTRRPRRIAVQFTNSSQVWRGSLLATHREHDLALLQVHGIVGAVPTVQGLHDATAAPRPGEPVALIGFPLGQDLPMRSAGEQAIIRASLGAGIVSKVLPDLLQVDGYGAAGASGSPIFDRDGGVVGVLYGGQSESGGRILYAVPATFVRELLDAVP